MFIYSVRPCISHTNVSTPNHQSNRNLVLIVIEMYRIWALCTVFGQIAEIRYFVP